MKDDGEPRVPGAYVQQVKHDIEASMKTILDFYVRKEITAQMLKNVEAAILDTLRRLQAANAVNICTTSYCDCAGVEDNKISLECVQDPHDESRVLIVPLNDYTKKLLIQAEDE